MKQINSNASNEQKLVSIIIPIYNVELYLDECLRSVCNQSYRNLQIILVNDGSTDGSLEIAQEYARSDPRMELLNQKNFGLSAARNKGLDLAQGEWIFFIDSDDYIELNTIETMVQEADREEAELVICSVVSFDETGKIGGWKNERKRVDRGVDALPQHSFNLKLTDVIACNKLYSKRILGGIRFPVNRFHEDEAVAHKILYKSNVIIWIPNEFYHYRQRLGSIMQESSLKRQSDWLLSIGERILFLEQNGIDMSDGNLSSYFSRLELLLRKSDEESFSSERKQINRNREMEFKIFYIFIHDQTVSLKEKIWQLLVLLVPHLAFMIRK